ncbi:MAG: putative selenium-dependent hydroxylase accessory protein YqeC [Lachnospiraceae bacterium]|nr:putative selenium-dependent hydroxylase accessory protein YqeC [Lachnospiraceae bacterium]
MIADILDIKPGITAFTGSGGKTSLIKRLAAELTGKAIPDDRKTAGDAAERLQYNNVIVCTTTHIMRPADMPVFDAADPDISKDIDCGAQAGSQEVRPKLLAFLSENTGLAVCVGVTDPENPAKLVSFPIDIIRSATGENTYILVEADGAKHMPVKAHNDREPVIPEGCEHVIVVVGAEGFDKRICDAVHRPEIFASIAGVDVHETVTPQNLAKVLKAEKDKFGTGRLQVFVNRSEEMDENDRDVFLCSEDISNAGKLAELTGWEVYAGAAVKGIAVRIQ